MIFNCPFCTYDKKVPDNYINKKIKCPRCLATLTLGVPQPTALTALPLPDDDVSPLEQTAIEVGTNDGLEECPFCFELISVTDKQCPMCHSFLEKDSITGRLGVSYHNQAKKIFYLGLASLVFGLGIIFGPISCWLGSKIISDVKHPSDRDLIYAGMALATIGTTGSLVFWMGMILL